MCNVLCASFAYLLGPLGGVLGVIFQVFGDEMLVDTFKEVGVELSQDDRAEIQDFMQTTNTLIVCAFPYDGSPHFHNPCEQVRARLST